MLSVPLSSASFVDVSFSGDSNTLHWYATRAGSYLFRCGNSGLLDSLHETLTGVRHYIKSQQCYGNAPSPTSFDAYATYSMMSFGHIWLCIDTGKASACQHNHSIIVHTTYSGRKVFPHANKITRLKQVRHQSSARA